MLVFVSSKHKEQEELLLKHLLLLSLLSFRYSFSGICFIIFYPLYLKKNLVKAINAGQEGANEGRYSELRHMTLSLWEEGKLWGQSGRISRMDRWHLREKQKIQLAVPDSCHSFDSCPLLPMTWLQSLQLYKSGSVVILLIA